MWLFGRNDLDQGQPTVNSPTGHIFRPQIRRQPCGTKDRRHRLSTWQSAGRRGRSPESPACLHQHRRCDIRPFARGSTTRGDLAMRRGCLGYTGAWADMILASQAHRSRAYGTPSDRHNGWHRRHDAKGKRRRTGRPSSPSPKLRGRRTSTPPTRRRPRRLRRSVGTGLDRSFGDPSRNPITGTFRRRFESNRHAACDTQATTEDRRRSDQAPVRAVDRGGGASCADRSA